MLVLDRISRAHRRRRHPVIDRCCTAFEALDTASDDVLARVITAMAEYAGVDVTELAATRRDGPGPGAAQSGVFTGAAGLWPKTFDRLVTAARSIR
jgi:hypothetical protein